MELNILTGYAIVCLALTITIYIRIWRTTVRILLEIDEEKYYPYSTFIGTCGFFAACLLRGPLNLPLLFYNSDEMAKHMATHIVNKDEED